MKADHHRPLGLQTVVVERGIMPPWFASETKSETGTGDVHAPWANDRSLAAAEKQDLPST
ncbi:MAG: hypothetical protein R3C05_07680 [Pirellulaceae bacterium]